MKQEITDRQIRATEKINRLLSNGVMKSYLYKRLDIHFLTFDQRLKKNNWKRPELELIESLIIQ